MEILDNEEKRYLKNIIEPFQKRPSTKITIIKGAYNECWLTDKFKLKMIPIETQNWYYIIIKIKHKRHEDTIFLPWYRNNTMYKGMELDKYYTTKELGLE